MTRAKQIIGYRYHPGDKPDGGYYHATLQVSRFVAHSLPKQIAQEIQHTIGGITAERAQWYSKRLAAIRDESGESDGIYLEQNFDHESLEFTWQANRTDCMTDEIERDPKWYGLRVTNMPVKSWAIKLMARVVKYADEHNIDRLYLSPLDVVRALGTMTAVKYCAESYGDWVEVGTDKLGYSARQLTHVHAEAPVDAEAQVA